MIGPCIKFMKEIFLFRSNDFLYKVQDVDTCTDRILLTHGNTGANLTVKLSGIYSDKQIIRNLAQHHCCWLGYYFGRLWRESRTNYECVEPDIRPIEPHRYMIISINRNSEVVYSDSKDGSYQKEDIYFLADSRKITGFSQDDAFYIGFLCGSRAERPIQNIGNKKRPKLKVVK